MLSALRAQAYLVTPGICLAFFLAIALTYASSQSLWVDEATQLSGIQLGFSTQLKWLLGAEVEGLRVPHDRTPPLSYWIGRVWYLAFGPHEFAIRLLGITAVFVGLVVLY
jgi:4-amino-4-deoxy-L-arabinose transferase-like glycosyltransferase